MSNFMRISFDMIIGGIIIGTLFHSSENRCSLVHNIRGMNISELISFKYIQTILIAYQQTK